jgi:phosphoglycolate phosphatase
MRINATRGVVFDLDATLIDSHEAIYLSFRHTYEKLGLPTLSFDEVRKVVGYGLSQTFRELLGEERVPIALGLFRQKYEEIFREHTHLLPGAREVLEALYARGIQLAIATNKLGRFSREIFRHFGLDQLFTAIVGDEDVAQNKPYPDMLLFAIEKMGLRKEEVIMVGDSLIDVKTAQNAGVRVFAIATGITPREDLERAQPTWVFDKLIDLLDHV